MSPDLVSTTSLTTPEDLNPSPPAATKPTKRERNPLFDAVVEACQFHPEAVAVAGSRVGKAVSKLRAAGEGPEAVAAFAADYRRHWPGLDLTPEAMVKHWPAWRGGAFASSPQRRGATAADRAAMAAINDWRQRNGQGGGAHGGGAAGGVVPALPDRRDDDS